MTLPPQPPHSTAAPPPPPPPAPQPISQPPSTHSHAMGQLPGPPPQWQGAEDSMRSWLAAKTEEERRRQEEEKTRQESLRLEQRRIEADMLRTSLSGGIPPPIVPLVFAGMGGGVLPPAAMEWAQQFLNPHVPWCSLDSKLGPRAAWVHGIPRLSGNERQGYDAVLYWLDFSTSRIIELAKPEHKCAASAAAQQEAQPSPSIYFHHWHPPTSQAGGGSTQPATPSGASSKTKRKRESL
ncbi:hypothetical protein COL26b_014255 [Colletotrichum chrysophilum]|uniref:uncharacterized protein n=1 Tax=Colletotrichum chrysophilum TaxID=1836956 RepID=UPI002300CEB1|nr:uncharacterized protein COL26b_014255 [Colletotrichum chrysophilum]KAJ0359842.1 hypothetical protein COL26b_014255 [Colletotrichum chrysophilum]